uniref:PCI domain-containing protein n=1 Tax=Aegilops tauschii subsp. strangulata TaxID=200361 RepID=A0A453KRU5_AEGTS
ADQKLTYALMHCNPQSESNLRKILKFLIPVKLSIGVLPRRTLLEKYNLLEYADIVTSLRRGDLRLLKQALDRHEDQLLKCGVYLVLEKLELQVYRRLVKKIHIIQREKEPSKAHQIKLEVLVKTLQWLGITMDVDEVLGESNILSFLTDSILICYDNKCNLISSLAAIRWNASWRA